MLLSLLKLILTIPFLLILPGVLFQLAIFGWKSTFGGGKISFFEKAVLTIPFSLVLVDLIILLLNRMNILIKGPVLVGAILIFCLICFAVFQSRFKKNKNKDEKNDKTEAFFDFSSWQTIFILLALVLAIFIRMAYLSDTIIPSSTDLGHHMYWAQTIINTGHLPDYGMPDFIIGEHMIFAAGESDQRSQSC